MEKLSERLPGGLLLALALALEEALVRGERLPVTVGVLLTVPVRVPPYTLLGVPLPLAVGLREPAGLEKLGPLDSEAEAVEAGVLDRVSVEVAVGVLDTVPEGVPTACTGTPPPASSSRPAGLGVGLLLALRLLTALALRVPPARLGVAVAEAV